MNLSQKCQYAIRSLLELAKVYGQGPVRISTIAQRQSIPQRFLENILNELKSSGLVASRRGIQGGYLLAEDPKTITVGRIIRMIDGSMDPVKCIGDGKAADCPLKGSCSLIHLWNRAKDAVEEVYDSTTFGDLLEEEKLLRQTTTVNYSI